PALQVKLLRVLQEREVRPLGSDRSVDVDVRVIAATNKDLEAEVATGRFREDLYYRLNVVPIHVPPLREHREDIPGLVEYFVSVLSEREGITPRRVSESAHARLMELDWPGNVRELRNTVERMLILATGPELTAKDVDRLSGARVADDTGLGSLTTLKTFEEFKEAAERAYLLSKLREFDWNVSETARAVEMPRSNLYKKIERYSLTREHS
ncbi:MAG TPA: sigma 54-interacting transcriptional regulator, partial [Gemmatimonadaceae bacterium]|nr:sigma 54-interacting transcriptional regulator [Gemmatimonadaceae bacterium]